MVVNYNPSRFCLRSIRVDVISHLEYPVKSKRRWPWYLLLSVILLAAVVAFFPYPSLNNYQKKGLFDPHTTDQIPSFISGEKMVWWFSDKAIKAHAKSTLTLAPWWEPRSVKPYESLNDFNYIRIFFRWLVDGTPRRLLQEIKAKFGFACLSLTDWWRWITLRESHRNVQGKCLTWPETCVRFWKNEWSFIHFHVNF